MNKFILAGAACVALAACGNPAEEADEPVVAETPAATPTTAANGNMAGTYEVTMADGMVVTQTIRADGTYSDVANGETTESGTWRAQGEQLCYDPEGPQPEECFTGSQPGADGSFQMTDADGNRMGTVRRIGDADMASEPAT